MAEMTQEPVQEPDGYWSHPAYGDISVSRITGGTRLYGSELRHNGFLRLRISAAKTKRDLSSDWHHADHRTILEVDMSEAQWAQFLSSANYQGTRCTIAYRDGQPVPGLPEPKQKAQEFAEESAAYMNEAVATLQEIHAGLSGIAMSKAKRKELQSAIERGVQQIASNQEFVAQRFKSFMERSTEEAKAEVNGHVRSVVQAAGLESLRAVSAPALPGSGDTPSAIKRRRIR